MKGVEEMKDAIQDWFSDRRTIEGVAKLYHELVSECDTQLRYMIEVLIEEMEDTDG